MRARPSSPRWRGTRFTEKISTKAEADETVAKVRIRFTVIGDATFTGGEKVAAILVNATVEAVAPLFRVVTAPVPRPAGGEARVRPGDPPRGRPRRRRNPEPCNCE